MKYFNLLLLLFLGLFINSCGNDPEEKTSDYSLELSENKTEYQLGDIIKAEIINKESLPIDSIVFFLGRERLDEGVSAAPFEYTFEEEKLGKWPLRAVIYSGVEKQEVSKEITLLNNTPPKIYTYTITAKYPHATNAYTQGLEFHDDTLYESTGQYGESTLRKVNLNTGEVLKSHALEDSYFAEGVSILNGNIYQLTWKEGIGFIYDLKTFNQKGTFAYNKSEEGWGLTNDGEKFYKSDGTEKIWILNGKTLAEETFIQTVTDRNISTQLNELEWVEGMIYANTYQRPGVAIINPENGAIVGVINFDGLKKELNNENELDEVNDVLNGIAYNPNQKKLYVTGKNWDTLFEVEIMEKNE